MSVSFFAAYHTQIGIGILIIAGIMLCILIATFKSVWLSDKKDSQQSQNSYTSYIASRQQPKSGMRRLWGGKS